MRAQPGVLPVVLSMGLDYLAWTQLTPMLLAWGAGVAMIAAILLFSFVDQTFSAIDAIMRFVIGLPLVGPSIEAWLQARAEETDGTIGLEEIKSVGLWIWGVLSLAFFLASALLDRVFGPFEPWTLARKLRVLALCCLLLLVSLFAVFFVTPEPVNGGPGAAAFTILGMTGVVFIVSTYCLSIAHVLGLVSRAIRSGQAGRPDSATPDP